MCCRCRFKKASKLYEKCAEICIDKNINKGSLRDYFYNALLCQFVVSARKGVSCTHTDSSLAIVAHCHSCRVPSVSPVP
jgi:hypothetical protein